jgi:hypothetical protein
VKSAGDHGRHIDFTERHTIVHTLIGNLVPSFSLRQRYEAIREACRSIECSEPGPSADPKQVHALYSWLTALQPSTLVGLSWKGSRCRTATVGCLTTPTIAGSLPAPLSTGASRLRPSSPAHMAKSPPSVLYPLCLVGKAAELYVPVCSHHLYTVIDLLACCQGVSLAPPDIFWGKL